MLDDSTICAIASPAGIGAISIIRLSGFNAFQIAEKIISKKDMFKKTEHGRFLYTPVTDFTGEIIDEVLCVKFYSPHSYTGENSVEFYCHGSEYIQKEILSALIQNGATLAKPGEFTKRAFLNGKMDLSQSEAVADLISSETKESSRIAFRQLKGNISTEIKVLRNRMIELLSLLELELDFSEEDVEFADRTEILSLIQKISDKIQNLIDSFRYGNAIKKGIPVVIAGEPNVGKSSLLNILLNEDRAIVSEIPGTTRDTIEEEFIIDGFKFRLIDTAGIRFANDKIEKLGIERTYRKITEAEIVIFMTEVFTDFEEIKDKIIKLKSYTDVKNKFILLIINKTDLIQKKIIIPEIEFFDKIIPISAKTGYNIENLKIALLEYVQSLKPVSTETIINSVRHLEILQKAQNALNSAKYSFEQGAPSDLISQDIREATYHLGEITGQISTDEVLQLIFEKFCIGK
ncbi:MAG TPA: tRNA uridine-5-carboxymethylaminomethyl(34) synthesis GTPase MnmE [Bacteroidales bacterium]|jgi:tRNA modification GTPase|nr:tRNA uridine-5-carboxymethylaminomethyl(34) synthesis GTPase MnmE [Bacteroidales bacterium]HOL96921.1 tRNA uridine-5-carboxymethylaminomethyl(34) synthesis GTPase MnmE [Bacteroidales bacterium]HOM36763.1 tRNA uridine-5-carboxymethylaminomethyl(34) synthesis GTPase MnmE [Bacteroidales bacterium]HPD24237.1 tRNA uridine-5-carboxymethylaminomethyl(34) synthesis GTPase MnmE [Bacteroidales bacterium]HRS98478.1 tRNA uridine-5-carboxymethylaminomethyl(34) synthesis GTPase MnmE [Bacteroidales bacteri